MDAGGPETVPGPRQLVCAEGFSDGKATFFPVPALKKRFSAVWYLPVDGITFSTPKYDPENHHGQ